MTNLTSAVTEEQITRVNQVYRAYLDTCYEMDYYQEKHVRLSERSSHIDFLIALGAAASGGSGLGILALPELAWLCGLLTTISTLGAIAKGNYDWSGRLTTYVEVIKFYTPLYHAYKRLREDVAASLTWNEDFQKRFDELRDAMENRPRDIGKELPIEIRRRIQGDIRRRENCTNWWSWRES